MLKYPYGQASFYKIRTENYLYIDKTRYIELLENLPESHILILRSRRFGKSLFVNMLGWYYDRRCAGDFDRLFQGLYIHAHPTPRHNTYLLLDFDFSGIMTDTLENANEGFTFNVRSSVRSFTNRYREYFSDAERERIVAPTRPNEILTALFDTLRDNGVSQSVYVLIDEYDHFANNILAQGKEMFKDLVRTDGYVRPFYEALKKGAGKIVDRIFVTGVLPILLDSLTSGFNISANLSTDERVNEMFGFTDDEITPILEDMGQEAAREEIRTYYNGYRFSPKATGRVYNSDMILYYGLRYSPTHKSIESMLDINVVSDYRKIRAILAIGDRALEEHILTKIVRQRQVTLPAFTQLFTLTQETEFRFDENALISLLFYMGYLTIQDRQAFGLTLRMPNLVLESLYLDYMEHVLEQRAEIYVRDGEHFEMLQGLLAGNLNGLVNLTEKLLRGLSNRDYERFDEKYIKVVMLSFLSNLNAYIPHSEFEVSADGYVDVYLQAVYEPEQSAHYFIELKYVKAKTTKAVRERHARAGVAAMQTYVQSAAARAIKNLQAYVLVFQKDKCVQKIQCSIPPLHEKRERA